MIDKDRVLKLLGSGLSSEMVANAIGCDPSYISQLLTDENFREEVAQLRVHSLTAASARDAKYDEVEDALLKKLADSLDYFLKPRDILTALATVNKMERRGTRPQESTVINNQVVNLSIPAQVHARFVLNSGQQVVAVSVGDSVKSMVTLDSKKLGEFAKTTSEQTQQLPAPSPQDRSVPNELPRSTSRDSSTFRARRGDRDYTVSASKSEELLLKELS